MVPLEIEVWIVQKLLIKGDAKLRAEDIRPRDDSSTRRVDQGLELAQVLKKLKIVQDAQIGGGGHLLNQRVFELLGILLGRKQLTFGVQGDRGTVIPVDLDIEGLVRLQRRERDRSAGDRPVEGRTRDGGAGGIKNQDLPVNHGPIATCRGVGEQQGGRIGSRCDCKGRNERHYR